MADRSEAEAARPDGQAARKDPKRSFDRLKIVMPVIFLIALGFAVAYLFVNPAPPSRIVLSGGAAGGAYQVYAERYRAALAREGVTLEIQSSQGSLENIQRLQAGEADVALVQGGIPAPSPEPALLSLGSVFYEPLWVFHRRGLEIELLSDLRGLRIDVGPTGSGTRPVALRLLADNGIQGDAPRLTSLPPEESSQSLLAGRIDALFLVASAGSPLVLELLRAESVVPLTFQRAEAYTRLHRDLSHGTLPEGVIDLATNIPAHDVQLVAPTANLVVREDFHPALSDLLLKSAFEVHSKGGLLEEPTEFPSPRYVAFPLSPEADRFYKNGPPFLSRYLPFWAATLVDRLKVMLIPLVALMLPAFRIMPPAYRWRVRSRIYRWYKELLAVDPERRGEEDPASAAARIAEIDRIADEVNKVPAPPSYAVELYDLRRHIAFVRERAARAREEAARTKAGDLQSGS